jgi:hypothetical protein
MKMFTKTLTTALAVSLVSLAAVATVRADDENRRTTLTFSQPFEIPGKVLPAGTYIFTLVDQAADRHVVQVFSADGKTPLAMFLTIPDYRLKSTSKTVIKFREVPRGQPEAIKAWFYPGNTVGEEFVYHKRRAVELAKVAKVYVPAVVIEDATLEALKAAPVVVVTPEEKEVPVAEAIQTTPVALVARAELPKTASNLPMIMLFAFTCLLAASLGLMLFGKKPAFASAL